MICLRLSHSTKRFLVGKNENQQKFVNKLDGDIINKSRLGRRSGYPLDPDKLFVKKMKKHIFCKQHL